MIEYVWKKQYNGFESYRKNNKGDMIMELEQFKVEKRELYKEIEQLKRDHKGFKRRVSIFANIFIPGIGFAVYGSGLLKGLISFVLFTSYNLLFFNKILPNTDLGVAIFYYVPAVVIWIASVIMVSSLDD